MRNKFFVLLLLLLSIIILGCDEFFETDLSQSEVAIIAPSDSIVTMNANQNFKWEKVKGAEWYNIRIVSPNFEKVELFLIDSNVTVTNFYYQLAPGEYEWGVKAGNFSSETSYEIRTIFVDSSALFSARVIGLQEPYYYYSNKNKIKFNWSKLEDADSYRMEIRIANWETGEVFYASDLNEDTISVELSEDTYFWGIKAHDNETNTETPFSTRKLTIDQTNPGRPLLLEPDDDYSTTESSVLLSWKRGDNNGAPVFDSIFIAMKNDFSVIALKVSSTDTTYITQPGVGQYYWRVRSYDKAGNTGEYSAYRQFNITEE